ncbi:MAG: hypothetical protein DRP47_12150 [Candidatus Zixiibacteriota bacterium]|nr:MAG: hypothetical protein DRP47_12150 [candidate division Zixibacteria bacterium]
MSNEDDDKLNRLLAGKGSIAERNRIAKELDDDRLQIAAPYSPQAKEELERRRHERVVARMRSITKETGKEHEALAKEATEELTYVDPYRINELRSLSCQDFDLTKLIELCEELNTCYKHRCCFAVAMLTRAIVDHIPPVFGLSTFPQVASNYGGKSFKKSMQHLNASLRAIADSHLHSHIRRKEVLPNRTQVNFKNDLDVLLAEVVRVLK